MLKNKLLFLAILSFAHFNLKSAEEEELTKQLVSYVINDSHDSIQGLFNYLGTVYPTYINKFISVPGPIRKMPDIHRFINASDEKGKTPLHYAVEHNRINIVYMFLMQEIYINEKDMDGDTPLHYAANNGNAEMVRVLLDAGADPNLTNNQGNTCFYFTQYRQNTEIAEMLISFITANNQEHFL